MYLMLGTFLFNIIVRLQILSKSDKKYLLEDLHTFDYYRRQKFAIKLCAQLMIVMLLKITF